MPTIAKKAPGKRLLSDLFLTGIDGNSNKRARVCFDDNIEILHLGCDCDTSSSDEYDSVADEDHNEEEEEVDFILSIGPDGDWDYSINTTTPSTLALRPDVKADPLPVSPFTGCTHHRQSCDLLMSPMASSNADAGDGPLCRADSTNSLGNNLTISLAALDKPQRGEAPSATTPTPLITPPSSPRKVRTVSCDGVTSEETTICEWPSNLTVDNAITAALESAPLSLPRDTSCAER